MNYATRLVLGVSVLALWLAAAGPSWGTPGRSFTLVYRVEIDAVPKGQGPIHVFIPLAVSNSRQRVTRRIVSPLAGTVSTDPVFGNHFWHGHAEVSDGNPIEITVEYVVERSVLFPGPTSAGAVSAGELEKYLHANAHVPISGEIVDNTLDGITPPKEPSDAAWARSIYDFVIDTMEYKKVGTGWGNGDTYWACSKRYGNCTDFHSLFISLARAKGIPARFEIGFPLPEDRPSGDIGGYHCWVEFYLADTGWVPIDASEAKKNPEKREMLFGTLPADRVLFTVGRDLELGAGHTTGPLNYFIYPHVEVAGKKWTSERIRTHVSYGQVSQRTADRKGSEERSRTDAR